MVKLVSVVALVANALMVTPLMDGEVDRFGFAARAAAVAPMLAGSLYLVVRDGAAFAVEGLSIQGVPLGHLLRWRSRHAVEGSD